MNTTAKIISVIISITVLILVFSFWYHFAKKKGWLKQKLEIINDPKPKFMGILWKVGNTTGTFYRPDKERVFPFEGGFVKFSVNENGSISYELMDTKGQVYNTGTVNE